MGLNTKALGPYIVRSEEILVPPIARRMLAKVRRVLGPMM
jgi:hypothetical protein